MDRGLCLLIGQIAGRWPISPKCIQSSRPCFQVGDPVKSESSIYGAEAAFSVVPNLCYAHCYSPFTLQCLLFTEEFMIAPLLFAHEFPTTTEWDFLGECGIGVCSLIWGLLLWWFSQYSVHRHSVSTCYVQSHSQIQDPRIMRNNGESLPPWRQQLRL